MITATEWAFNELDMRRAEEAKGNTPDMHVARRKRRQARGYSKETADDLVARAAEMDGVA